MSIGDKLEELYQNFEFEKAVQNDPIKFPKRYRNYADIEISALIASSFAYGSIKCFCKFLEELFLIMGVSPYDFVMNFRPNQLLKRLKIKYRFSSFEDIVAFLFILQRLIKKTGSIEKYFSDSQQNTVSVISNFVKNALAVDVKPVYGENIKPRGLLHFFPDPQKGSSCKRINLFLRWMVRNCDVDFGLWKNIKPMNLVVPLDIHIWKVSKKLGITKRNSTDLKTAIEITEFFKKINPDDPLKYDFVLCHSDINKLI